MVDAVVAWRCSSTSSAAGGGCGCGGGGRRRTGTERERRTLPALNIWNTTWNKNIVN